MNIEIDLLSSTAPNRTRRAMEVKYVTIHNTSNASRGADALAHARFIKNVGYYEVNGRKNWVSWHFTVDDKRVIQHLPENERGIHSGSGNAESVGIEICMHAGIDQQGADLRAARLTAWLLKRHGLSVNSVRPHQAWTGKACPALLLGGRWAGFLGLVEENLGAVPIDPFMPQAIPQFVPKAMLDLDVDLDGDLDHQELVIPSGLLSN